MSQATVSCLASVHASRFLSQSVFTPACRTNWLVTSVNASTGLNWKVLHPAAGLVHSQTEFVEPEFAMFGCVQIEVLLGKK